MAILEVSTISRLQANKSFLVNQGITEKQINELIQFANTDPQVRKFTSDSKRFRDREAFDKWSSQGRTIYTLVSDQGNLCGILWFGKKDLPTREFTQELDPKDYTVTFGIRTYGDARGKGLAKPFMRDVFNHFSPKEGIWLETSGDNIAGVRAYTNFGFRKITNPNVDGKILMILPKGTLR